MYWKLTLKERYNIYNHWLLSLSKLVTWLMNADCSCRAFGFHGTALGNFKSARLDDSHSTRNGRFNSWCVCFIITLLLNRKDSITFSIYITNRRINYGNWYWNVVAQTRPISAHLRFFRTSYGRWFRCQMLQGIYVWGGSFLIKFNHFFLYFYRRRTVICTMLYYILYTITRYYDILLDYILLDTMRSLGLMELWDSWLL